MTRLPLYAAAGLAALLAFAGPASAVPFGPASLTVNGATYTNFDVVLNGGGTPLSASQISVTPNAAGDGIAITSGFAAPPADFRDAAISYLISVPGGATGANINIEAGAFLGHAIAAATDTYFNQADNSGLLSLQAYCTVGACTPQTQTDPDSGYASFTGGSYTALRVQKDIQVSGLGGTAVLSIVNQGLETGEQPPTNTPEPASLALLGIGLVGLGVMRRRGVPGLRSSL